MNTTPFRAFIYRFVNKFDRHAAMSVLTVSGAIFVLLLGFDLLATQGTFSNILKGIALATAFVSAIKVFTPTTRVISQLHHELEDTNKSPDDDEVVLITKIEEKSEEQEVDKKAVIEADTFDLQDSHENSLESVFENQNTFEQEEPIVAQDDPVMVETINRASITTENSTSTVEEEPEPAEAQVESGYYDELVDFLKQEENKERGLKQKEFFSHQNDAQDRVYLGANISKIVQCAETYHDKITFDEVDTLLESIVHEHRIVAVWILVQKYKAGEMSERKKVLDFYMDHRELIDNWDMTDLAARNIIGAYVFESEETDVLAKLIESPSLWDKRSALMATHTSIANGETSLGLFVMEKVHGIQDELVQSAIGWVLKELFKQNQEQATEFMIEHFSSLSKQALRIGTERMEKNIRKAFLRGEFELVTA